MLKRIQSKNLASFTKQIVRGFYSGANEPMHQIPGRVPQAVSTDEAVACIQSGHRVFLHGAAATPLPLVDAFVRRAKQRAFTNVEVVSIHTEGQAEYANPEFEGVVRPNALFTGANIRQAVNDGRADFTPVFLRNIPRLFREGHLPVSIYSFVFESFYPKKNIKSENHESMHCLVETD